VLKAKPLIEAERIVVMDLAKPQTLAERFDLAISLEVAEHLPAHAADGFVHLLCSLSNVVLFSAATPLQGGTEHLNEQWPEYWAQIFDRSSYQCYDILRPMLWEEEGIDPCYQQNSFLYVRAGAHPKLEEVLTCYPTFSPRGVPSRLIHPEKYRQVVLREERIGAKQALQRVPRALVNALHRRLPWLL
jgi:hypothetical protein